MPLFYTSENHILHRKIFVVLALSLMVGIILFLHFESNMAWIILGTTSVITSIVSVKFKFHVPFLIALCVSMGTFLCEIWVSQESELQAGENTVQIEVEELGGSHSEWKKVIGRVEYVKSHNSLKKVEEKVLILTRSDKINVGDKLIMRSDFIPIRNKNNPGEFDAEAYWFRHSIDKMTFLGEEAFRILEKGDLAFVSRLIDNVREYLSSLIYSNFNGEVRQIASALVLGDKGMLSSEVRMSFGNAGAMHVLAVSGLHVGIILSVLLFVFKMFPKRISNFTAHLIAIGIIWFYAGITGFSPSVTRASFMFSVLVLSRLNRGSYDPLNILAFTAFIFLLFDPLLVLDLGFQLSYLAMVGIIVFYSPLRDVWYFRNRIIKKIWEATAVGVAAQSFTVPLILYHFHQFPNYFALSNLGIMIFAGLIMSLSIIFFLFHWVPFFKIGIIFLLGFSISIMFEFIRFIAAIPGSVATGFNLTWTIVLIIFLIMIGIAFSLKSWLRLRILSLILFCLILVIQGNRLSTHLSSEMIVFNSNQPVFAIKSNYNLLIFAHGEELKDRTKDIISSYSKTVGIEPQIKLMQKGGYNVKHDQVEVQIDVRQSQINVDLNNSLYSLILDNKINLSQDSGYTLTMPYLHIDGDYNLKEGPFIHVIE